MMVNLRADNIKLRARTTGIVRRIAGACEVAAQGALEATGGAVKPAILVAAASLSSSEAEDLLRDTQGNLRAALARATGDEAGGFFLYFQNSMIVTVGSLFLVLLFRAMAAYALGEYRFRGNMIMGLYLALGIMIPIRIGTVAILEMMVATGLVNTLWALILVYTAQGLPLAVFILSEFMRQVSDDLKNAGRIDGLSE